MGWTSETGWGGAQKPIKHVLGISDCCRHLRLSLLGDLCRLSFVVTPRLGRVRELSVYSLAPLAIWLRDAGGGQGATSIASGTDAGAGSWKCSGGPADHACPGDVAGVLTASAALSKPRSGGLASSLECGSWQLSSYSTLLSMPMKLPPPHPQLPWQALPAGAIHQYHIHCVQQILKENLLCARCPGEKEEAVRVPPGIHGSANEVLPMGQTLAALFRSQLRRVDFSVLHPLLEVEQMCWVEHCLEPPSSSLPALVS